MNQHAVVGKVLPRHARAAGVNVAQSRVPPGSELLAADEGLSEARAAFGAGGNVTEQLVVQQRTLGQAVTHVVGSVQADRGHSAAVEAGTGVAVAPSLVLVPRTVVHAVTAQEDGQAVAAPCCRTLEVGVRTRIGRGGVGRFRREGAQTPGVHDDGWGRAGDVPVKVLSLTAQLVRAVSALLTSVAALVQR